MIKRGKKLAHGLIIILGFVCASSSSCRSERIADKASDPPAPIANSSKPASESSPITWNEVASSYEHVLDYVCVYYRQGFNDGKVLARQSGLLGALAGKLRLDPNESLALADSRHPITEVGLGKIIERALKDVANPLIASHFAGEEALEGRLAYKFEFVASGNEVVGGLAAARKAVIWIDRELKLPVKLELYDAANTLLERHRFRQVRVNQKLSDKTFTL